MLSELILYANFNNSFFQNIGIFLTFSVSFIFFHFLFNCTNLSFEEIEISAATESYLRRHLNSDIKFLNGNEPQEITQVE